MSSAVQVQHCAVLPELLSDPWDRRAESSVLSDIKSGFPSQYDKDFCVVPSFSLPGYQVSNSFEEYFLV